MGIKRFVAKLNASGMSLKDIVSLSLSILAIIVSATSLYYTLWYEKIAVSVALDDEFPSVGFENGVLKTFDAQHTFVFINSGNRPIAVMGLSYWYYHVKDIVRDLDDCSGIKSLDGSGVEPSNGFEPFVIDPGKIITKKVSFKRNINEMTVRIVRGGGDIKYAHEDDVRLHFCVEIKALIPGITIKSVNKSISFREGLVGYLGMYSGGKQIMLTSEIMKKKEE